MTYNFLPSFVHVGTRKCANYFSFFFACFAVPKIWSQKVLSQQAPNTHLWLILSHSGLLLRSLQCHNELLKSFFCSCDLLLCLYSCTTISSVVCVVIGFFNFSSLSCTACFTMPCAYCKFFYYPEGFLL
jgi:hypothetical protein